MCTEHLSDVQSLSFFSDCPNAMYASYVEPLHNILYLWANRADGSQNNKKLYCSALLHNF